MQAGDKLHNGAIVISWNDRAILARWTNDITPYVTWRWWDNDPRTTYGGNYHRDIDSAINDFYAR